MGGLIQSPADVRFYSPVKSLILPALLGATVIVHAAENEPCRTAWEAYRAAAEKRGVKLFIKDFVQPDIPDAENYAAIPLIRAMFDERKPGEDSSGPFALPKDKDRPKVSSFTKGTRTDLGAWRDYLLRVKLLAAATEDVPADILRALEKFELQLQQLRDASARPRCKFPTRWESCVGPKTPHLSPLLGAGTIFALRTEVLLAKGDTAAALSEFHHAMRLREALVSEPWTIAMLVRGNIMGKLSGAVWGGLAAHRWHEPDLVAIEKELSGVRLCHEFQRAFEVERTTAPELALSFTTKTPEEIRERLAEIGLEKPIINNLHGLDETIIFGRVFVKREMLYRNVLAMHEGIDALAARFCVAPGRENAMSLDAEYSGAKWLLSYAAKVGRKAEDYPDDFPVAYPFLSTLGVMGRQFPRIQTTLQQTLLACALERFWIRQGAFPEKLDELVPQFIADVPRDIADGKPLRYRRNPDGGYDVWSVGENRKDDGGVFDPKKSDTEQADWIWHIPGPAKAP